MINKILKKRERTNSFYAIVGYRKILQEKKLKEIREEQNKLHHTKIKTIFFKPLFFYEIDKLKVSKEIILRQYLIKFLIRKLYFNYLMKIGGKKNVTYTVPSDWLNEDIYKQGAKLKIINKINFYIFALNRVFKSFLLFSSILKNNITNKKAFNELNKKTAYFFDLREGCFPDRLSQNTDNIVSWYVKWDKKLKNLKIISSNLEPNIINETNGLEFSKNGDPKDFICSNFNLIKFIFFYIIDLLLSLIYLFIGNLGNAIMLPELVLSRSVSLLGSNNIAGHYLFRYTFSIYRPLWTYIAEQKGSRISLYLFSLNADIKSPFGESDSSHAYFPSTWPEYMVWSKLLKAVIKTHSINNPKIYVENYIPFKRLQYNKIQLHKRSFVVFDNEPQQLKNIIKEHGFNTYYEYIYYNKLMNIKFFNDILEAAEENGFIVYHKRKRVLPEQNIFYKNFINTLEKKEVFYSIDPNYDPVDLIINSSATISVPFTSVSYIAKLYKKPSIYYDPMNYILKSDRNNNGVTLISGKNNLKKWVTTI